MTCYQKNFTPYQREVIAKLSAMLGNRRFSYQKTANNHIQLKIDGIDRVFHTGGTPSDFRSQNNFLSDIKAEIKRLKTPCIRPITLPNSQIKADAKKEVCGFVQHQIRIQLKRLKRNLRTIRKQEYKMLTELQDASGQAISCDQLAECIADFRRQQATVELEKAIQQQKGDRFVTPGLIKSAKQELVDFLNSQLATRAEYRERLQRRLVRSAVQANSDSSTHSLLQVSAKLVAESSAQTKVLQHAANSDNAQKANSRKTGTMKSNVKKLKASKGSMPLTILPRNVDNTAVILESGKQNGQSHDLVLPMREPAVERINSLKALSKEQIRSLVEDCQAALELKHQEDIAFLLNEMQTRDIDLRELEAALAA
ncbi:hypothetical protein ACQSNA_000555 [Vibrio metschnikovii]